MPSNVDAVVAIGQVIIALGTFAVAMIALWQIGYLKLGRRIDIVARDRAEWISLADAMIQYPKLVRTYANARSHALLTNKSDDELREFAFVNRVCELVSFNYYLCKDADVKSEIAKLYPEGIELTSSRMFEIWNNWGLKEDYNTELQQYIEKQVFKR